MADENLDVSLVDLPLWSDDEARIILADVCLKYNVPIEVLTELVKLQRARQHQERAHGINSRFEEILGIIE